MVLSLTAKGLTTGELSAHLAEGHGTDISKETICKITDAVIEEMTAGRARPLHPRHLALPGRGGRQVLAGRAHRAAEPRRRRCLHRRLRRPQRLAGRDQHDVAARDRADLRAAPHPRQLPYAARQHWDAMARDMRPIDGR
jgi:hypothetical protein